MSTLVGTQSTFHEALYALCELDYDAVEAYKAAINRLENDKYKQKLSEFMNDHLQHVEAINRVLNKHECETPQGPDFKKYLTQGKIILANLVGDDMILQAMLTNELDTNTAYERLVHFIPQWDDAQPILSKGLDDEKKHKIWFEDILKK